MENLLNHKNIKTGEISSSGNENALSFINDPVLIQCIIDNVQDGILIVNESRKILFYNRKLIEIIKPESERSLIGLSVGEALNCIYASKPPEGCGSTEACLLCGFTSSLQNTKLETNNQEVRILNNGNGEILDLKVSASSFNYNEKKYYILILTDIQHEKRRKLLERLFFHDIMNTAAGLKGLAEILNAAANEKDKKHYISLIGQASSELIEELQSQKIITQAENSEIVVHKEQILLTTFLKNIVDFYSVFKTARGKNIKVEYGHDDISIISDPVILNRIIGNMIKNALEDIKPGETVTVGLNLLDKQVEVFVHNPGCIENHVQLQIFQRSFSTKGDDRGLGTYSMRLLAEKYLQAKIGFTSTEIDGTNFSLLMQLEH